MASGREQRWALTVADYEYSIVHKAGKAHVNADALSRLPLPDKPSSTPEPGDNVFVMHFSLRINSSGCVGNQDRIKKIPFWQECAKLSNLDSLKDIQMRTYVHITIDEMN